MTYVKYFILRTSENVNITAPVHLKVWAVRWARLGWPQRVLNSSRLLSYSLLGHGKVKGTKFDVPLENGTQQLANQHKMQVRGPLKQVQYFISICACCWKLKFCTERSNSIRLANTRSCLTGADLFYLKMVEMPAPPLSPFSALASLAPHCLIQSQRIIPGSSHCATACQGMVRKASWVVSPFLHHHCYFMETHCLQIFIFKLRCRHTAEVSGSGSHWNLILWEIHARKTFPNGKWTPSLIFFFTWKSTKPDCKEILRISSVLLQVYNICGRKTILNVFH